MKPEDASKVKEALKEAQRNGPSCETLKGGRYCGKCGPCLLDDALDEALTLLAAEPAASQEAWKPIESAPKDGTTLVLLQWRGAWEDSSIAIGGFGFLETSDTDGREIYDWLTDSADRSFEEPTHWMPAPNPNAEAKEEDK